MSAGADLSHNAGSNRQRQRLCARSCRYLDPPKKPEEPDGRAVWAALVEKHGEPPKTHTEVTPRGGWHVVFKWDPARPVTNSPGALAGQNVDVRGEGGYIIVAPSVCIGDGTPKNVAGEYRAELEGYWLFATAPDWLYELILRKPEPAPRPKRDSKSFWRNVNDLALQNLDAWVPDVFGPLASTSRGPAPGGSPRKLWGAISRRTCRSTRTASRTGASTTWAILSAAVAPPSTSWSRTASPSATQPRRRYGCASRWRSIRSRSAGKRGQSSFARRRISTAASSLRTVSRRFSPAATRTGCATATTPANGSNGPARIGGRKRPHWRSSSAASSRASSPTTPRRRSGRRCATLALRAA